VNDKSLKAEWNRRIMVIDDNESIHDDFRKIIETPSRCCDDLEAMEALLLDDTPSVPQDEGFEVDSALQGQEGLSKVREAANDGRPYPIAFVDVRMSPGRRWMFSLISPISGAVLGFAVGFAVLAVILAVQGGDILLAGLIGGSIACLLCAYIGAQFLPPLIMKLVWRIDYRGYE
jgi:CheY-like chemotaxis protein